MARCSSGTRNVQRRKDAPRRLRGRSGTAAIDVHARPDLIAR